MATGNRLERYEAKRDFSRTREPTPGPVTARDDGPLTYTIQKHDARSLHFDLRLEHDGVLLSFAITKGPSRDPAQKRLAVRTEDHPLDYAFFEGTIPKGEYGGGTVMLWDRGTWQPDGDVEEGLAKGKLTFRIDGERLHGGYALVRMKGRGEADWLLVKERDDDASKADPVKSATRSIASNRTMAEIARDADERAAGGESSETKDEARGGGAKEGRRGAGANRKGEAKQSRKASADDAGMEGSRKAADGGEDERILLTHPDRVLFPEAGLTKADLAAYFEAVADHILPHVAGRPLSLVRCPEGRAKSCFFQKHHGKGMPPALHPLTIEGEDEPYLVLDDAEGLRACAQVGALELHVWGAPAAALDSPERLVLDLDPGEGVTFAALKKAAREVRDLLKGLDLPAFPLLTGGKGIHVVVPLDGSNTWADVKGFAAKVARHLAVEAPDRYIAKAAKAQREGRIFVDWLRNTRGATAIAPFSPRARTNAPVATPVRWEELSRISAASAFTVRTLPRRLSQLRADPWADFDGARTALSPATMKKI